MEYQLDVSGLEPCEPLERTLAALGQLGSGDLLRVLHRREPWLLFPLLEQQGYAWEMQCLGAHRFEILIWRRDDAEAAATRPLTVA
jgi:uncharacterized protein (DUF2249 family)